MLRRQHEWGHVTVILSEVDSLAPLGEGKEFQKNDYIFLEMTLSSFNP